MPYGGGMGGYGGQGGLGGFLKGALKVAGGFIAGGPAGALAGLAASIPHGGTATVGPITSSYGLPSMPTVAPLTLTSGGAATAGRSTGRYAAPGTKGYHAAKDGSGRWVRNRRRNFANGRALNRAVSRVSGFERMVKRNRKALRGLARI